MNLTELSAYLDAAADVFRLETRDFYASSSDHDWPAAYLRGDPPPDPEMKRPWMDGLAAAARSGHPRRRLRLVPRPVPDYVRYACEWGYVDNVTGGEEVRVLDEGAWPEGARSARWVSDVYIVDGQLVAMIYDDAGRFQRAEKTGDTERASILDALWESGRDFTEWWAANPDLHRDVRV